MPHQILAPHFKFFVDLRPFLCVNFFANFADLICLKAKKDGHKEMAADPKILK